MKIAVLGTGSVGQIMAAALAAGGHQVTIGTRDVGKALANIEPNAFGMPGFGVWAKDHPQIKVGTFAEAAAEGELIVNATNGLASLEALHQAGAEHLNGKVLLDIANELDFSWGMPPRSLANDETSLGEKIQQAFPQARVVKTLNTMNASVMVNPTLVSGDSTVFLSGNDAGAKATVTDLLKSFGWTDILDLGDISSARGVEMLMPLWLRTWSVMGNTPFNLKIVR